VRARYPISLIPGAKPRTGKSIPVYTSGLPPGRTPSHPAATWRQPEMPAAQHGRAASFLWHFRFTAH